jgi:hypothetical protein
MYSKRLRHGLQVHSAVDDPQRTNTGFALTRFSRAIFSKSPHFFTWCLVSQVRVPVLDANLGRIARNPG